jgi:endonuclease/exonuclease/phosphatase (EEP) superfamily protein YafD
MLKLTLAIFSLIISNSAVAQSVLCTPNANNQLLFGASPAPASPSQFSFVSWNIYKYKNAPALTDLVSLSQTADVIFVQEAMHTTELEAELTKKINFSFNFFKSFCTKENAATGVMTLSRYQLTNNVNLVSPDNEPLTGTPKVSGYSLIDVPGIGFVHLINTHGLNFNMGSKFENQITNITEFIKKLNGPVIWSGDFNTWSKARKQFLDTKTASIQLTHQPPTNDKRNQQLDHIYTRNLDALSVLVLSDIKSSDHAPIKAVFKIK